MITDVFIIILTAFAVFGGYCLIEMLVRLSDGVNSPHSVTVMKYDENENTYKKVRFINENMFNNTVFFITDGNDNNIYPNSTKGEICEISDMISNVLFTKNRP